MSELFKNKYSPMNLDDYIGDTSAIKFFIEKNDKDKAFLIYGSPGTGKSTMVNLLANFYNMDIFIINASDERNEINENIFHTSSLFNNKTKLIVFDECDGLSKSGFKNLEKILPNYSPIILICNDISKIPTFIKSKCYIKEIIVNRFDLKILADRIIKEEGLNISNNKLNKALESINSYRGILDFLQFGTITQKKSFDSGFNINDKITFINDNSIEPNFISLADIYMQRSRQGYKNGEKIVKHILNTIKLTSNNYPRTYKMLYEVKNKKKLNNKVSIIGFK